MICELDNDYDNDNDNNESDEEDVNDDDNDDVAFKINSNKYKKKKYKILGTEAKFIKDGKLKVNKKRIYVLVLFDRIIFCKFSKQKKGKRSMYTAFDCIHLSQSIINNGDNNDNNDNNDNDLIFDHSKMRGAANDDDDDNNNNK